MVLKNKCKHNPGVPSWVSHGVYMCIFTHSIPMTIASCVLFPTCFSCSECFPCYVFPFSPRCFCFLSMFPMFFHLSHVCFSHKSEEFGPFLFRVFFFSNRHVFSLMFPMFSTFCNHFLFSFWSHVSCIFQKRPKLFFICHFFQCFTTFVRWFFHCMFVFCFFSSRRSGRSTCWHSHLVTSHFCFWGTTHT